MQAMTATELRKPGQTGALTWRGLLAALFAVALYAVTMFSREVRLAGVLALVVLALYFATASVRLARSTIVLGFLSVFAAILASFFVQVLLTNEALSIRLALRQASYFLIFPVTVIGTAHALAIAGDEILRLRVALLAAATVAVLSLVLVPITPENWIWRANFENTTVFLFMCCLHRLGSMRAGLILMAVVLGLYASLSESGQGMMIALLLVVIAVPSALLPKATILVAGTMPIWFPAAIIWSDQVTANLDSNVNFRYNIWTSLYEDMARGELFYGRLGHVVYKQFYDMLVLGQVTGWEGIENIGAHNFTMQTLALGGIGAYAVAVLFLIVLAVRMTACRDIRAVAAYLALSVSLSLNQAESHFLNVFGTALLCAYIVRPPEPLARLPR